MKVLLLVDFLQDKLNNVSSSYEVVYMKRADVTKENVTSAPFIFTTSCHYLNIV